MKVLTLPIFLLLTLTTFATPPTHSDNQGFIETYAAMSVAEMQRARIPASIILAQAILESSWGQGTVAVEGNNFFGIKCNNGWEGKCLKWMDDEVDSSDFRSYSKVEESFSDHSDFLTDNIRYRPLFDIPLTDYRNWACGLKQYGYATDSMYAVKLIGLIEEYGLYIYDNSMLNQQFQTLNTQPAIPKVEAQPDWEVLSSRPDKFTILITVRFGPEMMKTVETVMIAPSYKLEHFVHPQPTVLVVHDMEEVMTSVPEKKIWPIYPVSESGHDD